MITADYKIEATHRDAEPRSKCTVIIPLYNYENHIIEALDSVYSQECKKLSLIVINDKSTDKSLDKANEWFAKNSNRFSEAMLISHIENQGLSISRNTAISISKTPYLFFLDADNMLYSKCITKHVDALEKSKAAFAYAIIEQFGETCGLIGTECFAKERFLKDNYIDAMTCIRRDILIEMHGYTIMPGKHGWEDYELWLRMCDRGYFGIHIPEIMSRYRVHSSSMLTTDTNVIDNVNKLIRYLNEKFSWMNKPYCKKPKE